MKNPRFYVGATMIVRGLLITALLPLVQGWAAYVVVGLIVAELANQTALRTLARRQRIVFVNRARR